MIQPWNEMDLTEFLQTEGRRRAAELAGRQAQGVSDAHIKHQNNVKSTPPTLSATPSRQIQLQAGQQQCGTPKSLSEALQQMGVVPAAQRL